MTVQEAKHFVARWRSILIPWDARTDAEAVRDMERSCSGVMGGMFLLLLVATRFSSPGKIGISFFAICVFGVAFWLSRRLRPIRQMFQAKRAQSFDELK